jgi:hypothetical protein
MLLDALKKAAGREECELCEITYSPLGKRRGWAACAARLGVPVEELHRDELPRGIARSELPCVMGRAGGDVRPVALLTRGEIAACRGSVQELERRLVAALASTRSVAQAARP